jgi:hypothetical protein
MIISMIATLLKRLGAVCLAFVIFWHVTQHAGPRRGKAIVQVPDTDDIVVAVDQRNYHVRTPEETPVVCDLEPGTHIVQVWRRGVLRGEEHFIIEAGKEVVIAPLGRPPVDRGALSGRLAATAEGNGPAGLAVRIRQPEPRAVHN